MFFPAMPIVEHPYSAGEGQYYYGNREGNPVPNVLSTRRTSVPFEERLHVNRVALGTSHEKGFARNADWWGCTRGHTPSQDYEVMNLSEWAARQGIHPQTAYRWFREGTLPVPARKMGRLIVVGDLETPSSKAGITALHARVSSGDQRAPAHRAQRVRAGATTSSSEVDDSAA